VSVYSYKPYIAVSHLSWAIEVSMTLDDFLNAIVADNIRTIEVSAGTIMHGDKHGTADYAMVTLTTKTAVLRLKRKDKGWIPV
jgi:hypothetical protein